MKLFSAIRLPRDLCLQLTAQICLGHRFDDLLKTRM